jgi:E3 ubiquitin-protein ligase HERC2
MLLKKDDRNEIWSCGYSSYGLLGQGDNKNESKEWAALSYDKEKLNFIEVDCYSNFAFAITDKGELYSWGNNGYRQMGTSDYNNKYSPQEVAFFKDYYTHEVKCGQNMILVSASPRADMEKKQLFVMGDVKGVDMDGRNNEGILHLKDMDNVKYKWMEAAEEVCYIGFEGEYTPTENIGVHEGYTCEVTKKSPIQGTMHFWKEGDKWIYVSEEGYRQLETEERVSIPAISFVTKTHIKDIPSKEWPTLDEKEFLVEENKDGSEPIYAAHNTNGEDKIIPVPKSNQENIFAPEEHDVHPLIFYRFSRPLKDKVSLPSLNLDNFFEKTDHHGFKIEVAPDYSFEKNKSLIKLHKEKYNKTINSIKKFEEKLDGELLEACETYLSNNGIDFFNNPTTTIEASSLTFTSKELKNKNAKDVQARLNAFLSFNENFTKVIPFVILDEEMIQEVTEGKTEVKSDTLSVLFMVSKSLAFRCTKNSYIKKIADGLPTNYDEPEVNYNRRLIQHKKDRGKVDNKGEWTTFGLTMKKVKEKNYEYLRVCNSSYKAWKANFVGEGSIDAGGPYRETLSNMTDELYSSCLPLLIPTQNNKNDHGLGRDLWTINPASTSPNHLEMYKFLGALIGMAFRAGHVMDLKFPSLFWKKFIGEPVALDDLRYSDLYAVQAIKDLEKCKEQYDKDTFEMATEITWTTQLSNGETVPVVSGGSSRKVLYEELEEYHAAVLKTRAEEGKKQMDAMKEGFEIVFPMSILTILNWRDVEERVRGPSEISVAALKSITEYSSCSADNEYVKRFWRVFEEFTNEEKSMFLKFVWGRARLPPAERLKDQPFKLVLLDDYRFSDHDIHFPEAHTCFFQLDLPRYTNDEACKSKILYAIQACGEIDTDNSSYSIADDGGNYDDSD